MVKIFTILKLMKPKKKLKKVHGWSVRKKTNYILEIHGIGSFWVNCDILTLTRRRITGVHNIMRRSQGGPESLHIIFVDKALESSPSIEELKIILQQWFESLTNFDTPNTYKRHCTLQNLDNNDNIVTQWNMLGCFPYMLHNNNNTSDLEITLSLDYFNYKILDL